MSVGVREHNRFTVDKDVCGLYRQVKVGYLVYFVDLHYGFTLTDLSNSEHEGLRVRKLNVLYRWSPLDSGQWERVDVNKLSIGE